MFKAAFFDIDGTLISFATHKIPDSAIQTIQRMREKGIKTFLSTGRNGDSTRFLMETGLFDGEILLSGQFVRMHGRVVFENPVIPSDIAAAVAGAKSGDFTLGFLSGHESFVTNINDYVLDACSYAGMAVPRLDSPGLAKEISVYQIHCYGAPGVEDELLRRTTNLTAVRWSPNFADVFPTGGGKDRGMAAICDCLGITPAETIAFGDGENDISMLKFAGVGVAMGNATEAAKQSADFVTKTVDEHGVAYAAEVFSI